MRNILIVAMVLWGALGAGAAQAMEPYRQYAEKLVTAPPDGIQIRPDMEAELDELLAQTRRDMGAPDLEISNLFKKMARAQAMDMVLGDFVGHQSVRGEAFGVRFRAFADGVTYQMNAENAARDRQKGPVDRVKAKRLFTQWLNSPGHNQTLKNPAYLHVSTGAVAKGNHLYAVQIFWAAPISCGGLTLCTTYSEGGMKKIKDK